MYFRTSMNSAQSAVATPDMNASFSLFSLVISVFTTPRASFNSFNVVTFVPVTA